MIGHVTAAALIIFGICLGIAAWIVLLRTSARRSWGERELIRLLLWGGLIARLLYASLNPTFNSPDEESHFNYVRYLSEHRALAIQTTTTNAPTNDWEYHQAPLYYVALWPVYEAVSSLTDLQHPVTVAMRFVSILWWLIAAVATLRMLDRMSVVNMFVRVFTMGLICLLPSWVALSSSINNDVALVTWSAMILERLARGPSYRNALVTSLLCAGALLTKLTSILIVPVVGVVYLIWIIRRELELVRGAAQLALIAALAAALWSPLIGWNLHAYHHPLGMGSAITEPALEWPSPIHALRYAQQYAKETFWVAAGEYNRVRFLPVVGVHVTYAALIGLLFGLLWNRRRLIEPIGPEARSMLLGLTLIVLVNVAIVLGMPRFSHGHGRFLFPLIGPIGVLWSLGLIHLGLERIRSLNAHVTGFFVAYLIGFVFYDFAFYLRDFSCPGYL